MPKPLALEPDYGNWVSKKFLYGPGILTILFLGLSLIFPWLAILAFVFFACFVYFAYAHYRFSSSGGNI